MVHLREIMDNSHDMSDISMLFLPPKNQDLEQAKRLEDQRLRQCHAEQRQEATYDHHNLGEFNNELTSSEPWKS